ncbi:MAG: DNA primase (EC, partial [uncultured Sulfurovum sp.]
MKKRQDKTLSYIDKISKDIIEALENGTAPWIKPWSGSVIRDNAPFNPLTGKQYEGINFLNLSLQSMAMNDDPRWMTFKQAQSLKAQVKKGEKGTSIQYWKFTKQIDKLDADGKKVLDANSKPIKVTLRLKNPQVFYATVFNATQIDGLRSLKEDLGIKEVITEFKPIEA